MQTLAIIPARGGSERIPKKNIKQFLGKPIIAYSIKVAQESGIFDEIIVSTDDEDIAKISTHYGAKVPRLRPPEISDSKTGTLAVVAHELNALAAEGEKPSEVCLIYATAPLLRVNDLAESYACFKNGNMDFVFAAAPYVAPVFRAFTIQENGRVQMLQPEYYHSNSQDLPDVYHDAGQFCWGRWHAMLDPDAVVFSERSVPFILPSENVVDINTMDDWDRAELLYKAHKLYT